MVFSLIREDYNGYSFLDVGTKTVHPPQLVEEPDCRFVRGWIPFGRHALIRTELSLRRLPIE